MELRARFRVGVRVGIRFGLEVSLRASHYPKIGSYSTCRKMRSGCRLQPHVLEAATLCAGGCNPMCARLPEDALEQEGVGTVHVSQPQRLDG